MDKKIFKMQNNLPKSNIPDVDALFTLDSEEVALAGSKNTAENKVAFAAMLKFFQIEGRYCHC